MALKSNNTALSFKLQAARDVYNEPNGNTDLAVGLANCRPTINGVTVPDDSYTGSVFRNADAIAGKQVGLTFDVKLKPPSSMPAANDFVLGRLLQAAKFSEVRTTTAIPASPEAIGGSGNTTTIAALGASGSTTDGIYNGFPLLLSDNGANYKQRLTAIRQYTGSGKLAELMETLGAPPAANWQIPTFLAYFTDYTSAEPPVLSAKMWVDGYLTEFVNCGVTGLRLLLPTSTKQQAQFPRLEFTLDVTIHDTSDEASPTIPAAGAVPLFKDADCWFNRQRVGTQDITVDFGLQGENPPNPNQVDGTDAPEIAGGSATANIVMQKYLKATLDTLGIADAQGYHPLFTQWGNGPWNTIQMMVRHGRLNFPSLDLSGGIAMEQTGLFIDVFDRNLALVFAGNGS
jgi:hypothetical protein